MGIELFIIFIFLLVLMGLNDVPSFMSDISNLCLLSFFLFCLARVLLILPIFSKSQFLVLLAFSLDFLFFNFLIFKFYFLYFVYF